VKTGGGEGNSLGFWVNTLMSSVADMRMRRSGGRAAAPSAEARARRSTRQRERRPMRTWKV
jgi:hypothetical protein